MAARKLTVRPAVWVAAVLLAGATAYLVATALQGASAYYLSVEEALERAASTPDGLRVRVRGSVVPGSVEFQAAAVELRFSLGPEVTPPQAAQAAGLARAPAPEGSDGDCIHVVYRGAPPDNLTEGMPVIVEGRLSHGGVLVADQVLVTCPSRYEAEAKRL